MATGAKVSLFSDVRFGGGEVLARCGGILDGEEDLRPDAGEGGSGYVVQVDPTADWVRELQLQHVLEVEDHFGERREWRVAQVEDGAGLAKGDAIVVRAQPLVLDLLQVPIRETLAGVPRFKIDVEGTAAQLLQTYAVAMAAYPWLALGVIESDEILNPPIEDWSVLELVRWIQGVTSLELPAGSLRRDDVNGVYRLDLLKRVGAGAPAVYTRPGRNIVSMQRQRDREELRNVVLVRGDTVDGASEPATLGRMVLRVTAWDAGTRSATIEDPELPDTPIIAFDDQFGGSADVDSYFALLPNGTLLQIEDTVAGTQQIQLAAGTSPTVGDLLELRADSSGTLITELANPPLITALGGDPRGRLLGKITVDDGRPERNEVKNPLFRDWDTAPWDPATGELGSLAFQADRGTATRKTGKTITLQPTQTIPAGRLVLLYVGLIGQSTTEPPVSDTAGNTWAKISNGAHQDLTLWASVLANPLTTSDAVSVTAAQSGLAKLLVLEQWSINGVLDVASQFVRYPEGSETDTPVATISGLTASGWTYVGLLHRVDSGAIPGYTPDPDFTDEAAIATTGSFFNIGLLRGHRVSAGTTGETYSPTLAEAAITIVGVVALRALTAPASVALPGTFIGNISAVLSSPPRLTVDGLRPNLLIPDGAQGLIPSTPNTSPVTVGQVTASGGGSATIEVSSTSGASAGERFRLDISGQLPAGWSRGAANVRVHRRGRGGSATGEVDGTQSSRALLVRNVAAGFSAEYGDRVGIGGANYTSLASVRADAGSGVRLSLCRPLGITDAPPSFTDGQVVTIEAPTWPEGEPLGPYIAVIPALTNTLFNSAVFHIRYLAGLGPLHIAVGLTYFGPTINTGASPYAPPKIELLRSPSTVLLSHTDATRVMPDWFALHVTLRPPGGFTLNSDEDLLVRITGITNSATSAANMGVNTMVRWVMAYQGEDPNAPPVEFSHANRLARRGLLELRARRFPARMTFELDDLSVAPGYVKGEERLEPGGDLLLDIPSLAVAGETVRLISVVPNTVDARKTRVEVDTRPRSLTRLLALGGL